MTLFNGSKDRRNDERKADLAAAVSCLNDPAYKAGSTVYEFRDDSFYRRLNIPLRKGFADSGIASEMPKPEYQNGWHRDIAVDQHKGVLSVISDFEYTAPENVRRIADSMISNDTVSVLGRVVDWVNVDDMQIKTRTISRQMSESATHPNRLSEAELELLPRVLAKPPFLKEIHTVKPGYQAYTNSYSFVFSINLSLNFFDPTSRVDLINNFVSRANDIYREQRAEQKFGIGITLAPLGEGAMSASLDAFSLKPRYIFYRERYDEDVAQGQARAVEVMSSPVIDGEGAISHFVRLFKDEIKPDALNRFLINGRR